MSLANCKKTIWLLKIAECKINIVNKLSPFMQFGLRLWIANVFWKSAVLKMPTGFLGVGQGSWDATLFLFEYEHPVPFLSPEVAAFTGTFFEFLCPILLVLGLGTRSAAAILLIMTAFIELSYVSNVQHHAWMLVLGVLLFNGAGKLSLDYIFRKKYEATELFKKVKSD